MIQPGTAITVRLLRPLTSADAEIGQPFAGFVVAAEAVKGSSPVRPGTLVEGMCLAVRRATGDSCPGYLRLVLRGLKDPDGRFAPLETTTFSEWGGPGDITPQPEDVGGRNGPRLDRPEEEGSYSNQLLTSVEALLPVGEDIKFVVLKPSLIPPGFSLP